MQNTANDELITELQLQANTYNHNKVTQTFKPKKIESSVSQQMVAEYKRQLMTEQYERMNDATVRSIVGNKPVLNNLSPLADNVTILEQQYNTCVFDTDPKDFVFFKNCVFSFLSLKSKYGI